MSRRLALLAVQPDGAWTLQPLQTYTDLEPSLDVVQVLPDSEGGVLAWWREGLETLQGAYVRDGAVTRYVLPAPGAAGTLALAGDDGVGYLAGFASGSYDSVTAFDLATGTMRWTSPEGGWPIVALAEGGVAVQDGDVVKAIDEFGGSTQTSVVAATRTQ